MSTVTMGALDDVSISPTRRPPWQVRERTGPVSRQVALYLAVLCVTVGAVSLAAYWPIADERLRSVGLRHLPTPTRALTILLNGAVLMLLALRSLRSARRLAFAAMAFALIDAGFGLSHRLHPFDTLIPAPGGHALPSAVTPETLTAWNELLFALAVPGAALLLARQRVSEARLLSATALGMLLVGGASLLAISHAAQLTAPLSTMSGVGLMSAAALGTAVFLLVADRQKAPCVPPRWSPEMAAMVALACAVTLWRALDNRVHLDGAGEASALPTLVLVLGLGVSGLLYLTLRLLRRNWQQAQRLAHQQLSRAFDSASDGVWEYDVQRKLVCRSSAQLRKLGYEPLIVNGTPGAWMSLVHPDDRDMVSSHETSRLQSAEANGELLYRVRAANGAYHTIIDRGRVVERDDRGNARLIMGISADVTEHERVERERRESERRFRAMFDCSLQGQVLLDERGICLEVNATALAIVGGQREDVVHAPLATGPWFTGLSEARAAVESALADAIAGHSVRFETDTHLLDGRIGLLECSLTPLACEAGRVQQILCELRDVTDHRRSEEALREIGALTTMGRLAARVAHEINNPLAGIQNAFLLLGDAVPVDHPHRRFLQAIDREIQRIALVTRSLYETYRQDSPPGAAGSMALAVNDAVSFLDQVNRSRNIRIRTDLTRAPALVPVPDALLRQTLYNLVQNAVEASPVGGEVTVVVHTDHDECVITVHDEGTRVPDHLRERIFEPMSGTRTTQLRTGSMGIGLSLVRQSVRALGGTVMLLDTPGHGATFEVRLPMTSVVQTARSSLPRESTGGSSASSA